MAKVLLYGILEEMTGTSELSMAGSRVLDVLMSLCSLYGAEFREIVFGSDAVFSNIQDVQRKFSHAATSLFCTS